MSHLDKKVFGKKSYSDLLKEIYDNQKKKETQISALINELKQDYESALTYAKQAAQIDSENEWYRLVLAGMHEVNAEYSEASKLYEQITTKHPGREVHIDVSEDGENGAHIEYAKY